MYIRQEQQFAKELVESLLPKSNGNAASEAAADTACVCRTHLFCPVCGHEFLPEEIGRKPHCRRCGYLESCCNPE